MAIDLMGRWAMIKFKGSHFDRGAGSPSDADAPYGSDSYQAPGTEFRIALNIGSDANLVQGLALGTLV